MPKIKTHKATSKRFTVTGGKKLMRRKAGQDHFNSRQRGLDKVNKRRDVTLSKSFRRTVRKLTPYR